MTIPLPGLNLLSDDAIFYICLVAVLVPWGVLIFAPTWDMRPTVVKVVVMIQCAFYAPTMGHAFTTGEGSMLDTVLGFASLDGVIRAFSNTDVILPCWLHIFGFDVLIANTLVEQNLAASTPLPQPLMGVVLALFSVVGPAMYMLFAILQKVYPMVVDSKDTKKA